MERLHGLWERWEPVLWDGLLFACLALPAVLVAADSSAPARALTLVLAALLALWHWAVAMRRDDVEERPLAVVWLAGIVLLLWALLERDARFALAIWGLYPQVFILLGRWAIGGVAVLTLLVTWQMGALTNTEGGLSLFVSLILAILVGYSLRAVALQSEQRKAALETLEATRAELAATAHRAGTLEERTRVAREVHDTVAQGFVGILTQLEACEEALGPNADAARARLQQARTSARDSLAELRRVVRDLRPQPLDGVGLVDALERTVATYRNATGAAVDLVVEGTVREIDPSSEVALLRVLQEGLANVAKHAGAAVPIETRLRYDTEGVHLQLFDGGPGFDPAAPTDGLGLRGIRERIDALGGQMTVEADGGTRLHVTVPT